MTEYRGQIGMRPCTCATCNGRVRIGQRPLALIDPKMRDEANRAVTEMQEIVHQLADDCPCDECEDVRGIKARYA